MEDSSIRSPSASDTQGLHERRHHLGGPAMTATGTDVSGSVCVPGDALRYVESLENDSVDRLSGESITAQARPTLGSNHLSATVASSPARRESDEAQISVLQWINAYRFLGHFAARIDPLGRHRVARPSELSREHHRLNGIDRERRFDTGSLNGLDSATLDELEERLEAIYCGPLGAEYMHLLETDEKRWIQRRLEGRAGRYRVAEPLRTEILDRIVAAETLERYLHTRYVGQKRFSLEGAESLMPVLNALTQRAGANGAEELVLGMAHRGRLNVLVNLLGKPLAELNREFEGHALSERGSGDVKYHMGFSSDVSTPGGPLHLVLAFNPSHLEIVSPVVQGSVRARQVRLKDRAGRRVIPVVIHGDAALAGQGVVMETLSMSQTRGFSTKGTVHVVVNNQIGFTISTQRDARSTYYATDVAKMVSAPIFHVNGDDPEACVAVAQLALDYRMRFAKDVFIDLVCYRRHGHNEADEPAVTQPRMYDLIRKRPTTAAVYAERLIAEGTIPSDFIDQLQTRLRAAMDSGGVIAPNIIADDSARSRTAHQRRWKRFVDCMSQSQPMEVPSTGVDGEHLVALGKRLMQLPEGFTPHRVVAKLHHDRIEMLAGNKAVDWGLAETLAYATLIDEGFRVRLVGQDSGRGTFAHRHAVLHDNKTGQAHVPLRAMHPDRRFLVIDSLLSEEAVLAFEYGYATTEPDALVLWEAQFGDFTNGAQVVIDQFLSSGEAKWGRLCGLVLLLPHGFEGQGPEHSSARPERFLQLSAEGNWRVATPTTAAQIFHLLRNQMKASIRRPLVVFTPKSLLRHPRASVPLEALTEGTFQPVMVDVPAQAVAAERVLFTTGRLAVDLVERLRPSDRLLRIEQLYPWPQAEIEHNLNDVAPAATSWCWAQDEPENQGAMPFFVPRLAAMAAQRGIAFEAVARPEAAAPAVGYPSVHRAQFETLLARIFGDDFSASAR
ncbi:MAG: 2-oxoglutarate dehydrogenase E1 component [Thioalkalivibrionaceae bacterium]